MNIVAAGCLRLTPFHTDLPPLPDILTYLRSLLGIAPRREQIRRTVAHPRLGALNFVGWRLPPNGPVAGHWEVTPGELPDDWRKAFRLDALNPPGYDDERPDVWQVSYWCSGAEHWFVIELSGRDVLSVDVEG